MDATLDEIRSMPLQDRAMSMAVVTLIDRVQRLSEADREDLFQLLMALGSAKSPDDFEEICESALEILQPRKGQLIKLPTSGKSEQLKKWKTHVAGRIHALRKQNKWTQEDLATRCGIPQSHISRIESERLSPSHATIERIAKAFKVEPGEIDPSS